MAATPTEIDRTSKTPEAHLHFAELCLREVRVQLDDRHDPLNAAGWARATIQELRGFITAAEEAAR